MENKLKNVLYALVAVFLLAISNYLVIIPLYKKSGQDLININTKKDTIVLEKLCEKQHKLYSKYSLITENIDKDSQSWFQVNIRSDVTIKFQYTSEDKELSKLNISLNDRRIENDEDFFEYDKFMLNIHLYGDIVVIEHKRAYNHIPFIKIINLNNGSMQNLRVTEDFYINNIIVDEYGLTAAYSRLSSPIEYYIEKGEENIPFRISNNNVSINLCNKNLWPEEIKNLEYVAFDMSYTFDGDTINFNNPNISNMRKVDAFLEPYKKEFSNICKK